MNIYLERTKCSAADASANKQIVTVAGWGNDCVFNKGMGMYYRIHCGYVHATATATATVIITATTNEYFLQLL